MIRYLDAYVYFRGSTLCLILEPDLERGGYSVRCPHFNATAYGDTVEQAIEMGVVAASEAYDVMDKAGVAPKLPKKSKRKDAA